MSSHFATLNGLRLHFVRHVQTNASQKYPVILLHGFNQTSGRLVVSLFKFFFHALV